MPTLAGETGKLNRALSLVKAARDKVQFVDDHNQRLEPGTAMELLAEAYEDAHAAAATIADLQDMAAEEVDEP